MHGRSRDCRNSRCRKVAEPAVPMSAANQHATRTTQWGTDRRIKMIRSSNIVIAAAFGIGGLVAPLVASAWLVDRGAVVATKPRSGLDRGAVALPDGPVGQGQSVSMQGSRLWHCGQHLSPRQDRLLQLHVRRGR